jgi:hypothetical protein
LTNGWSARTISEQTSPSDHIPIFINHFIAKPSENATLLRVLFAEKSWSAKQIAAFTGWSKTSVIEALQLHDITREAKPALRAKYGWKLENGILTPHVRQQLAIAKMKKLRGQGQSFKQIAQTLNQSGTPAWCGHAWDYRAVNKVLNREGLKAKANEGKGL